MIVGEFGENRLRFNRDVYLLVRSGELWLSPDRRRWAPVQNPAAWKEVFGLGSGSMSFGLGIHEDAARAKLSVTVEPAK